MEGLSTAINLQLDDLSKRWRRILDLICPPSEAGDAVVGEAASKLLKSAGKIEQVFGGINSQLWDDPTEWTLPEVMSNRRAISEYLDEVDQTRREGMARIRSDEDLQKEIWTPKGAMNLSALLLSAVSEAFYASGAAASMAAKHKGK